MSPKMLREQLCRYQAEEGSWPSVAVVGFLIDLCDMLRPLGPDGNHGDRHTPLCGCDDIPAAPPAPGVEGVMRANADLREQLEEARTWARHGYELAQRSYTWSDHGVAPAWLTEGHDPAALAGPDPHAACEASRAELVVKRDRAVRRAEKAEGWARRRARDRDDARARLARVRELAESWMSAQAINRAAIKRGSFAPRTTPGPEDFLKAIDEPQRVFIAFDGSTGGQPVVGTGGPNGAVRFHMAAFPPLGRDQVNAAIASARLRADLAAGLLHHGGTL